VSNGKKKAKDKDPKGKAAEATEVGSPAAGDGAPDQSAGGPLFYAKPEALNSEQHSDLLIKAESNYGFSRASNSVPLNAVEFGLAVRHYPIVFTGGDPALPVVVLGLRSGQNMFLAGDSSWEQGVYVPAYIRRYPFIFMSSADGLQFTLCVDAESDLLEKSGERGLFKDGEATDLTNRALEFCQAFQAQHEFTRQFAEAVSENGLLSPRAAEVTLKSGEKLALGGFRIIDEGKFNALSGEVFLEWRQRGWLHLVYSHLMSLSNWAGLVDRTAAGESNAS
jgi:hypothetical protein